MGSAVPSTSDEFIRRWKRRCPDQVAKLGLLVQCGPTALQTLIRKNLPADLLSDMLVTLAAAQQTCSTDSTTDTVTAGSCVQLSTASRVDCTAAEGAVASGAQQDDAPLTANWVYRMLVGISGRSCCTFETQIAFRHGSICDTTHCICSGTRLVTLLDCPA